MHVISVEKREFLRTCHHLDFIESVDSLKLYYLNMVKETIVYSQIN